MDVDGVREMLSNLAGWRAREYVSLHGRIAGGLGEFVMPGHRLVIERHRQEDWLARAKAIVDFMQSHKPGRCFFCKLDPHQPEHRGRVLYVCEICATLVCSDCGGEGPASSILCKACVDL
jgi:hypothetical protein